MARRVRHETPEMLGEGPSEVEVTVISGGDGRPLAGRLADLGSRLKAGKVILCALVVALLAGGAGVAAVGLGTRGAGRTGPAPTGAAARAPVFNRASGRVLPAPGTIAYSCPVRSLPAAPQPELVVCP